MEKNITYSKNYDREEIILNFDASLKDKLPENWEETDLIKVLGSEEYPIDKKYTIIHK
jgi:hypothetical protein